MTTTSMSNADFRLGNNRQIVGTIKATPAVEFALGEALALDSDGTYIKWDKTAGKIVGFTTRAFTMGDDGTSVGEYIVVGGVIDGSLITLPSGITTASMVGDEIREEQIPFENLAAGADISARAFFSKIVASAIKAIGILSKGTPTGINDSNTCVILVTNEAGDTIVTKTYNTGTQPPTNDYESLGAVDAANTDIAAGGIAKVSVTQGATADLPAFDLVVQYVLKTVSVAQMLTAAGFEVKSVIQTQE